DVDRSVLLLGVRDGVGERLADPRVELGQLFGTARGRGKGGEQVGAEIVGIWAFPLAARREDEVAGGRVDGHLGDGDVDAVHGRAGEQPGNTERRGHESGLVQSVDVRNTFGGILAAMYARPLTSHAACQGYTDRRLGQWEDGDRVEHSRDLDRCRRGRRAGGRPRGGADAAAQAQDQPRARQGQGEGGPEGRRVQGRGRHLVRTGRRGLRHHGSPWYR